MADSTLNRFLASGTNAQRLAFTPSPPTPAGGPGAAYIWTETDTGNEYWWNASTNSWVQFATGGGGGGGIINSPSKGGTYSTSAAAFASKGNAFYCGQACHITKAVTALQNTTAGTALRGDVFPINSAGSAITGSSLGSATATGAIGSLVTFTFSPIISLTAGNYYAIMVTATAAASGTTALGLWTAASAVFPPYNELVNSMVNGVAGATQVASACNVAAASTNPVNGTALSPTTGAQYYIGLMGTVP